MKKSVSCLKGLDGYIHSLLVDASGQLLLQESKKSGKFDNQVLPDSVYIVGLAC